MATPVDHTQAPKGMVYSSFVRLQTIELIVSMPCITTGNTTKMHDDNGRALVDDCDLLFIHCRNPRVEHQVDASPARQCHPKTRHVPKFGCHCFAVNICMQTSDNSPRTG